MQMSDGELLRRWNNALDKRAHVEILADLNAVSKAEMHAKLAALGAEGLPEGPKKRERKAPAAGWVKPNLKIDELKAMALYRDGLCDREMAEALGVSKTTVCQWRKRMRLTPNGTHGGQRKLSEEMAMALYREGLCDQEIGDAAGVTKGAVRHWRETRGLAPNLKRRATGLDETRAWDLYNEGLCDLDMAEALGVSRNTVADWRKKNELKCHRQKPGYVQRKETKPSVSCADSSSCTREPLDRTGQDRRCAPVGKEEPVEKQEHMGVEGLLRVTQRVQEAFPQGVLTIGGRYVRDVRVHIFYGADGEVGSAEMELILEEAL